MQVHFARQLTLALSTERLNAYKVRLPQSTSDLQLFGRYVWNMALSESLYPSVQLLEIALRNTIHRAASQHFGRENWFDVPDVLQHNHERDAIQKAKIALTQRTFQTLSHREAVAQSRVSPRTHLVLA